MRIEAGRPAASTPPSADEAAVRAILSAWNAGAGWPDAAEGLLVTLKDAAGQVRGGVVGRMNWRWLWVMTLAVEPALRGQGWGARLLAAAEAAAQEAGCIGVRLDTYSFQARGFYEKQGYAVAGAIADCPPGQTRYTMTRRLAAPKGET